MSNLGPRVCVKRDEESSVGRGCELYGAHFRPEMACIVWSATTACRELVPAIKRVWLTEGRRDIREKRDLHKELRALDITFRMINDLLPTRGDYERIADRMKELLGSDYDVIVHKLEGDALHVHVELDPH